LVIAADRCAPAGPWNAFDRRRPPDPRHHKGPTRREIHQLSRAHAQHGMHAGLGEEGEVGIRTQASIGHEHIARL
jgi:hypothetical protein